MPKEMVLNFIKAGMNAPSAMDQQPWHFILIDDRKVLDNIPNVHPSSKMCRTAQAAILVCADMDLVKSQGYWIQDCAAATQNILLSIADKGLGGVWLGVYPRPDRVAGIRGLLDIPENIIPFSMIPIGYPDEDKLPKNIFKLDRVRYNNWNK